MLSWVKVDRISLPNLIEDNVTLRVNRQDGLGPKRADSAQIKCVKVGDAPEASSKDRHDRFAGAIGVTGRTERNRDLEHARISSAEQRVSSAV